MGTGGGVQRIEVTERERPVFGGAEFGAVGPYERCMARYSAPVSSGVTPKVTLMSCSRSNEGGMAEEISRDGLCQ
jgi:hypothetical protein